MSELTRDQQAYNAEKTWPHRDRVRTLLNGVVIDLLHRGEAHDLSKLVSPEVEEFAAADTPDLAPITYGTPEYEASRKRLGAALAHHYAHNRHHPEHFKDGVNDMTLLDLIEMLVDWKASSERHHDGNIRKSIEHNANRFGLSPQLTRILENTADVLFRI